MKKIHLTQGQFALVDDEDYEYLSQLSSAIIAYDKAVKKYYPNFFRKTF